MTAVWIILRERNNFNYTTPNKQWAQSHTRIANNDVNTHVNLDAQREANSYPTRQGNIETNARRASKFSYIAAAR